jgi:hypothetical protein
LNLGQRKRKKLKWSFVDHVVEKAEYSKCQSWEQKTTVHMGRLNIVCWTQENLLPTLLILRVNPLQHCLGDYGQMTT